MSTRGNVGYKNPKTGKFHVIYNHFDSYPEGLGEQLLKKYNYSGLAKELVDGGDMSTPGDNYAFDRGEDWEDVQPRIVSFVDEIMTEEYAYLWDEDRWYYTSDGTSWNEFKTISKITENENQAIIDTIDSMISSFRWKENHGYMSTTQFEELYHKLNDVKKCLG